MAITTLHAISFSIGAESTMLISSRNEISNLDYYNASVSTSSNLIPIRGAGLTVSPRWNRNRPSFIVSNNTREPVLARLNVVLVSNDSIQFELIEEEERKMTKEQLKFATLLYGKSIE